MRLLELFARLDELTQRVFTRNIGPITAVYGSAKADIPTHIFIANDAQDLHSANNATAVQLQPTSINKMYTLLLRKVHQTGDATDTDKLVIQVIENLQRLRVSPEAMAHMAKILPMKIRELPSRAAMYKYVTTDLGKGVSIYDHLFGERPVMGEEDYMPFHNARLFLPDGMTKRGRDSALNVLETVYQKLEHADEATTFGGDIHFAKMASRVGGTYDVIDHDIKINPRISKSDENVFSLLHEYGHKRMYEQMSKAQHDEIKKKYWDLKRDGETHMEDLDYAAAVQDMLGQLEVGTPITYVGRKRNFKNIGQFEIKGLEQYKGKLAVQLSRQGKTATVAIIHPGNILDPKKWDVPTLGEQRPKRKEKWETNTDQWFPSQYSESEWDEWWAEMYAFFIYGNLSGEPAQWMQKMLIGDKQLNASIGGNEGEMNSDDDANIPPPEHHDEEGNASWDWTDPYHSSGAENAVNSNTP